MTKRQKGFQNPTIYIGDLRIDEPITTLTDLLFIGVCFFGVFQNQTCRSRKSSKHLSLVFLINRGFHFSGSINWSCFFISLWYRSKNLWLGNRYFWNLRLHNLQLYIILAKPLVKEFSKRY
jgi:hypothetical protein